MVRLANNESTMNKHFDILILLIGWFLSMKPEHSYFKIFASLKDLSKLYAKDSRFGEWNPETVGLLLVSQYYNSNL